MRRALASPAIDEIAHGFPMSPTFDTTAECQTRFRGFSKIPCSSRGATADILSDRRLDVRTLFNAQGGLPLIRRGAVEVKFDTRSEIRGTRRSITVASPGPLAL